MNFKFANGLKPLCNEEYRHFIGGSGMEYFCSENEYFSILNVAKADYELLSENKIENNHFALLCSDKLVTLFYCGNDGILYVSESENKNVPSFEEEKCEGEFATTFFAFENDHSLIDCGMCLLVQCKDSSFFVIDSGHYFQFNDNDRIYAFMRERTPEGQKVKINGWLITHGHTDHISKLIDFLKFNMNDVEIDGFYHNLLSPDYPNENWSDEEKETARNLLKAMNESGIPQYYLHSGERFYVKNLRFDVLCTHEDIYPDFIDDYNDSSVCLMLTAESTKILIPGDSAVKSNEILMRRFDEFLKADIVQVAHHGHTGLSKECYEKINAACAIFPITKIMFDAEYPKKEANRRLIEIADEYYITSDGTLEIPLPYKTGNIKKLPDESFEDFAKIRRIWRYTYSDEYKAMLYERFLENGGNLKNNVFPVIPNGFIEKKPPLDKNSKDYIEDTYIGE